MNYKDSTIKRKVVIESGHSPTGNFNTYHMSPSDILPGVALGILLKKVFQEDGADVISVFYGDDYNTVSSDDYYEKCYGYKRTVDTGKVIEILNPDSTMNQSQMNSPSNIISTYLKHFARVVQEKPEWNRRIDLYYADNGESVELSTTRVLKKKKHKIIDEETRHSCPLMTASWTAYKTGLLPSIKDMAQITLPPVLDAAKYYRFMIDDLFAPEVTQYSRNHALGGVYYNSVTILPKGLGDTEKKAKILLGEFGIPEIPDTGVYFDPSKFKWTDHSIKNGNLPTDFNYTGTVLQILEGLDKGLYDNAFYPSINEILTRVRYEPRFVILRKK